MPLLLTQQSRGSVGGLGKSLFMFRLPTASNMSLSSRPLPADQDVNMMVPTQQQPYQNNTSQPHQYLLATFALFSFVYSPLTQSYSSAIVIIIINGQAFLACAATAPPGSIDQRVRECSNLVVSVLVFLSMVKSWFRVGVMATRILDIFHAKEQIESTSRRAPVDIKTLTSLRLRDKLFSKDMAQVLCSASPDSWALILKVLGVVVVRDRMKKHLAGAFVKIAITDNKITSDLDDDGDERQRTFSAASELGGSLAQFSIIAERLCILANRDEQDEVSPLILALVLYQRVFHSHDKGQWTLLSLPPSPDDRSASIDPVFLLKKTLGSGVLDEECVQGLEDAREPYCRNREEEETSITLWFFVSLFWISPLLNVL
ncbi:hypothetical protein JOM56_012277 [Amanita muscaria]